MKIKQKILTGLVGLILSFEGCANLPNVYRNNLTVNKKSYQQEVIMDIYKTKNHSKRAGLQYILNPSEIYFDDFEIKQIKGVGYSKWKPKSEVRSSLIYLNGLESNSGWFSKVANALSNKGIVIYGLDRRGSGLNSRIKGNGKDWIEDIDKIVNIAKKEYPNASITLASFCFGARPATAYAIKNQNKINSLIYISPGFNIKVEPNVLEVLSIVLDCFGIQTNTQTPIKKDEMFTLNPKYLDFIKNDKLRVRAPNSDSYIEGQKLLGFSLKNLNKIKIPSLFLLAEKDKIADFNKNKKTAGKFGVKPKIIEYDSEHTIFFENPFITTKFIKDIYKFLE